MSNNHFSQSEMQNAIILLRERELVALFYVVAVCVLSLFLAMAWIGLQCVIVAFSGLTHLPFGVFIDS